MTKHLPFLVFLLFQAGIGFAQTPGFEWVHTHGGTSSDNGAAIASDHLNNTYIAGTFSETVDFDPGTGVANLTSANQRIFIQKLNTHGDLIWVKSFPADSWATVESMAVDASGNVILGGYFFESMNFITTTGTDSLSTSFTADAFIVKMNTAGDFVWARSFGRVDDQEFVNGVATDDQGNVYATGHFHGYCDFDPGPGTTNLNSAGASMDIFVQKLTAGGDFVWAKKMGGGSFDEGVSLAVKGTTVLVTGWFQTSGDFDPSAGSAFLNSQGSADIFLVSLTTDGNFNWAKSFGSIYTDQGFKVLLASNGEMYLTGVFGATIDLDPGPATNLFTTDSGTNFFILKLTAAGDFDWARSFTGTSYRAARSIALHPTNGIVAVGEFTGTTDFDCGAGVSNLTAIEQADVFIVYLDQNGNYKWAGSFGNTGISYNDLASDVTVDNQGNIYTTGWFVETIDFDCGAAVTEQTSAGFDDIYIHKLNSNVLSVDEKQLNDFKLYPNPANEHLSISAESLNNCHAVIYNSLGKMVLEKELSDTDNQLDIRNLSPGSYVVKLTNETGLQHQNFLKID